MLTNKDFNQPELKICTKKILPKVFICYTCHESR